MILNEISRPSLDSNGKLLQLKTNFCYLKTATPEASGEARFEAYKNSLRQKTCNIWLEIAPKKITSLPKPQIYRTEKSGFLIVRAMELLRKIFL
jgi:hypothetical protein